jgi:hypothetical protein
MTNIEPAPVLADAYDPTSPAVQADPYPYYASLRVHAPVQWHAGLNVWIFSRHDDVFSMLRDSRWSSNYLNSIPADGSERDAAERQPWHVLLFMDSKEHHQLRRVIANVLDARLIGSLAAQSRLVATELLDRVRGRPTFDLINEFSAPVSLRILTRLLGVADSDLPVIAEKAGVLSRLLDWSPSPAPLKRAADAGLALIPFFARVVQEKRSHPGDDLISALVDEAKRRRLRYSDIVSTAILLLAAGHVTSTHMVGNGVLALLRAPAILDAWKSGRYQTAQVLDELLRFDAPVQVTPRTALVDLAVGGRNIRRGQMALGLHGSANRDGSVFPDPDTLDPGRRTRNALSFGAGAHFCVGAVLARATGAAMFDTLIERCPNLRLADEPLQWMPTVTQRGLAILNVSA